MQQTVPPTTGRFPVSARQEPIYSSSYMAATYPHMQGGQSVQGGSDARDGQQTSFTVVENGASAGGGAAKPASTRGRKRKTPPPTHDAGDQVSAAAGQFASFAGAVDAGQPQQQQTSSQYSLDPGMQAFNGGGEVDDGEHGDRSPGGHSSGAGGNSSRSVNPSKRAEQNRKAQRAFRERRDAHVKELEGRSAMLDQVMMDLNETNRRFEECRHMVDALRAENQRLTAALQQYTSGGAGAGQVQVTSVGLAQPQQPAQPAAAVYGSAPTTNGGASTAAIGTTGEGGDEGGAQQNEGMAHHHPGAAASTTTNKNASASEQGIAEITTTSIHHQQQSGTDDDNARRPKRVKR